jgi:hypothetical protein
VKTVTIIWVPPTALILSASAEEDIWDLKRDEVKEKYGVKTT